MKIGDNNMRLWHKDEWQKIRDFMMNHLDIFL